MVPEPVFFELATGCESDDCKLAGQDGTFKGATMVAAMSIAKSPGIKTAPRHWAQ